MSHQAKPLKILVYSIYAAGHVNACIGLSQALAARGHQVHFFTHLAHQGKFRSHGFGEILLHDDGASEVEKVNPARLIAQHLQKAGIFSNRSPYEKARLLRVYTMAEESLRSSVAVSEQVRVAIEREQPDVILVDHFLVPPCIIHGHISWVVVKSGNPLALYDSKDLPPYSSGLPSYDRSQWEEYDKVVQLYRDETADYQNRLMTHFKFPMVEQKTITFMSPFLNIYGYPEELDYTDLVPMPENFVRVDAYMRQVNETFRLPEEFAQRISPGDKLVYISLGSMCSIDVALMKRIVGALTKSKHWYIVSKGPLHQEYELPENMWGREHLPQTKVLPLVDLVITHGGNNTVTEAFYCGKPMIVLPLFADQFDNAQRITEKGYGIRLEAYDFEDHQLIEAVDQLLNNEQLHQRLRQAAKRITESNSKEKACIALEQMFFKCNRVKSGINSS